MDEGRLVQGLQAGEAWARAALVDLYGVHVRRVLVRVLGAGDAEVDDLAQETMLAALQGVKQLQSTSALKGWLTSIAVFSARGAIRKRQRWRWLRKDVDTDLVAAPSASADVMEAARSVYKIMAQMPVDERIPFALRMFEGMELQELVVACDMSMATLRRRLASAQARFDKLAAQSEALRPWIKGKVRGDE
ncbi:MAG: sigma-70 family RNA polymerase sigma factor [Deltaproteobacteria bacterium]|nr:sigma-70 family RNA polymerase sigma factor [Deltaproteobacteria bacterium]